MSPATRANLGLVGAAITLGLLGDLLLTTEPWGINLFLCVAALVAAGAAVVRHGGVTPASDAAWLALTAILLGSAFVRRDAEFLQVLDFFTLVGVLGLAAAATRGTSIRGQRIGQYVATFASTALGTLFGGPLALNDVSWRELPMQGRLAPARGILLGALIATPFLLLFGGLFAGADPMFSQTMKGVFDFDLGQAMAHTFRTGVLASLGAGYLRTLLRRPLPEGSLALKMTAPTGEARVTPTVTALLLLDALFLFFVIVQLRYFFGGAPRVTEIPGLTYAEYARRGFFELLAACALVLPLLLGAEWAVRGAPAAALRRFRLASGGMLALLAVIVASALQRMRLYVAAYGLTEDRLYATAAMLGIVTLLAWLAWTVLRGRGERFAFGALLQGLVLLAGLHVLNPDAYIVRHNLARPGAERPFDVAYAASLSADVAPVLLDALPQLSPADACVAAKRLAGWGASAADWRSWNWSRARAARIARDARVIATQARCVPAPTTLTHPTPDT
jgi:hypothetical protein